MHKLNALTLPTGDISANSLDLDQAQQHVVSNLHPNLTDQAIFLKKKKKKSAEY